MSGNMTSYTKMYRAAVALNNTGIAHIQKGLYSDGFKTLKDAVALLKFVRPLARPKQNEREERVRRASTSLLRSSSETPNCSVALNVCEISYYQGHTLPMFAPGTSNTNTSDPHVLLRIEVQQGHRDITEYELTIETAIMLYNLATATACHYQQQLHEQQQQKQKQRPELLSGSDSSFLLPRFAMRTYLFAQLLLSPLTDGCLDDDDEPDLLAVQLESLVLVELLRLQMGVAPSTNSLGNGDNPLGVEAKQDAARKRDTWKTKLVRNNSLLHDFSDFIEMFHQSTTAAAA